jgi:hypothetical protein
MGKINKGNGILGGFSGTVGTVVGGNWRGIDTMRAVAKPRKAGSTPTQMDQQLKFSVATKFVSAKSDLLEIGFRDFANQMTGTNSALSHTLKYAMTGVSPNFTIDYSKVMVSRGSLTAAENAAAVAGQAGMIAFTWFDNSATGKKASPLDKSILVAYCEATNTSVYTLVGAQRSAAAGTLAVPGFSGKTVQTWMAFMSVDGSRISNSVFTGQVNVL